MIRFVAIAFLVFCMCAQNFASNPESEEEEDKEMKKGKKKQKGKKTEKAGKG